VDTLWTFEFGSNSITVSLGGTFDLRARRQTPWTLPPTRRFKTNSDFVVVVVTDRAGWKATRFRTRSAATDVTIHANKNTNNDTLAKLALIFLNETVDGTTRHYENGAVHVVGFNVYDSVSDCVFVRHGLSLAIDGRVSIDLRRSIREFGHGHGAVHQRQM
jgi:hypothetical protein